MIYEFMRAIAGPYLRSFVDYYISYQSIFNVVIVIGGFLWILYRSRKNKVMIRKNRT